MRIFVLISAEVVYCRLDSSLHCEYISALWDLVKLVCRITISERYLWSGCLQYKFYRGLLGCSSDSVIHLPGWVKAVLRLYTHIPITWENSPKVALWIEKLTQRFVYRHSNVEALKSWELAVLTLQPGMGADCSYIMWSVGFLNLLGDRLQQLIGQPWLTHPDCLWPTCIYLQHSVGMVKCGGVFWSSRVQRVTHCLLGEVGGRSWRTVFSSKRSHGIFRHSLSQERDFWEWCNPCCSQVTFILEQPLLTLGEEA